jgi:hypothetical protein
MKVGDFVSLTNGKGIIAKARLTSVNKNGGPNSTLANCKGVRVLSVSEPNNDGNTECNLNVDLIKYMTGRDPITCRELYKSNITYIPLFNVFLQCNDLPNIKKLDNGITRRLRIINYPFQFVETPINTNDKLVNTKLKDEFKNARKFYKEIELILLISALRSSFKADITSNTFSLNPAKQYTLFSGNCNVPYPARSQENTSGSHLNFFLYSLNSLVGVVCPIQD